MKTTASPVRAGWCMIRYLCVMVALRFHTLARTVQGYTFVVSHNNRAGRRYYNSIGASTTTTTATTTTTTTRSSRRILFGPTPTIDFIMAPRSCSTYTSHHQHHRCFMSSISPEASPAPSINGTQAQQKQRQRRKEDSIQNQSSSSFSRDYYSTEGLEQDHPIWDQFCDLDVPEGRVVGLTLKEFDEDDPDSLEQLIINNSINHNNNCSSSISKSHWIHSVLHPDEVTYVIKEMTSSLVHRETFIIGRVAIREALKRFGVSTADGRVGASSSSSRNKSDLGEQHHETPSPGSIPPILKDEYGRPTMPKGYLGSISHKDRTGVGIVASVGSPPGDIPPKFGIGIDLERTTNSRRNIARRVLTQREIESLGQIEVSRSVCLI